MNHLRPTQLSYFEKQTIYFKYTEHLIHARNTKKNITQWSSHHSFLNFFIPKFILTLYVDFFVKWRLFRANQIIKQYNAKIESINFNDIKDNLNKLNPHIKKIHEIIFNLAGVTFKSTFYELDRTLNDAKEVVFRRIHYDKGLESRMITAHRLFEKYLGSLSSCSSKGNKIEEFVQFCAGENRGTCDPTPISLMLDEYQIYLMPKKEKTEKVIKSLIQVLEQTPELCELIEKFTLHQDLSQGNNRVPSICIHPIPGEENAKKVINLLNQHLSSRIRDGSQMVPLFSKPENALISYSNGDIALKTQATSIGQVFNTWFTQDGTAFKNPEQIKQSLPDLVERTSFVVKSAPSTSEKV